MQAKIIEKFSKFFIEILSDEFKDKHNDGKINHLKNQLDRELTQLIENNIKDEHARTKAKDEFYKEEYKLNKFVCLYNEDDKQKLIKEFFSKNIDLKIEYSTQIEEIISFYIDKINEIIRNVLSNEDKLIISLLKSENKKQSEKITEDIGKITKNLLNTIKENIQDFLFENNRNLIEQNEHNFDEYRIEHNKEQYFDSIIDLYKIQDYNIEKKNEYFVASIDVGMLQIKVAGIPVFLGLTKSIQEDIYDVIRIINSINNLEQYRFIHIITNCMISADQEKLLQKYNANIFTREQVVNKVMDFSYYLKKIIKEYENNVISKHYIDVYDEFDGNLLEYTVSEYLRDTEQNALLILGDYGCGKTSFLLNLQYNLAIKYFDNKNEYIPLYIKLRDYTKSIDIDNIFEKFFFKNCNIKNNKIETFNFMQMQKKFLILFDGFDEVAKRVNYDVKFDVFNQICKYIIGETKIILTSRPNYFQEKEEYKNLIESIYLQFEPHNTNNVNFQETYISELKPEQIKLYIDSFKEELAKENLTPSDIEHIIKKTHDLTDLAKRPFLLYIIIKTLPQFIDDIKHHVIYNINAANLYKKYTNIWLDRENYKGKTLIRKEDKMHFCKYLAFEMYKEEILSVNYKDFPLEIKKYFSKLTDSEEIDYFSHDIQSCSFLNSDGYGNFKFIHKSFMEYFVACMVADLLKQSKNNKGNETTYDIKKIEKAINITHLTSEVALFINDILDEEIEEKNRILDSMERIGKSSDPIIRENVISIISKARNNVGNLIINDEKYRDYDFNYAFIKDVTISNVDFSNAVFCESYIENVIFINCCFNQASFKKAILNNVDFSAQDLAWSDLSYCNITKCIFKGSWLIDAKMMKSNIKNCNFYNCDMSGTDSTETVFENNYHCDTIIGAPYEIK